MSEEKKKRKCFDYRIWDKKYCGCTRIDVNNFIIAYEACCKLDNVFLLRNIIDSCISINNPLLY